MASRPSCPVRAPRNGTQRLVRRNAVILLELCVSTFRCQVICGEATHRSGVARVGYHAGMMYRFVGVSAVALAIVSVAPAPSVGQTATRAPAKSTWTVPRTADGQPDLQGYWTNATFTPLER